MIDKGEIASFAARDLFLAVFLWGTIYGLIRVGWSIDLIIGSFIMALIFGFVAFLLTLLLLVPLERISLIFSESHSFLMFLLVGFIVPACIIAMSNYLTNRLFHNEEVEIIRNVLKFGALGAITATSAWWHLMHPKRRTNGN